MSKTKPRQKNISIPTETSIHEETPLLSSSNSPPQLLYQYKNELLYLLVKALPIISTQLLYDILQMTSAVTAGYWDESYLPAVALANVFTTITMWAITSGVTSALETYTSQVWMRTDKKELMEVYLERGIVLSGVAFIPITILWWFSAFIFKILHQDQILVDQASVYLRYLLLGAPAYVLFHVIKAFMQGQTIMHISTISVLVACPTNLILSYVLTTLFGFVGVPIAISCSYWVMLAISIFYAYRKTGNVFRRSGWNKGYLAGWGPFLRLSIPSIFVVGSEWWVLQFSCLAAAKYLGDSSISAQYILIVIFKLMAIAPFGISVVISNRIGNLLGKVHIQKARLCYFVALFTAITIGCIGFFVIVAGAEFISCFFTQDEEVIFILKRTLIICGFAQMINGVAIVNHGVFRGLGHQPVIAMIVVPLHLFITLPIGYYISIELGFGVHSFWAVYTTVLTIGVGIEMYFLYLIDWNKESKRIIDTVKMNEKYINK